MCEILWSFFLHLNSKSREKAHLHQYIYTSTHTQASIQKAHTKSMEELQLLFSTANIKIWMFTDQETNRKREH